MIRPTIHRALPDLSRLDPLFRDGPVAHAIAACSVAVMVVGAFGTIRTGRWWWRLLLVGRAVEWPLPDHPLQRPIIVSGSYTHGIHAADLLSVLDLLTAILPRRRFTGRGGRQRG